jgi:hypothetical protein
MRGESGQTGNSGPMMAGMTGDAGPSGIQGVKGDVGATGFQGATGIVEHWSYYRNFEFDRKDANIRDSERDRAPEIAAYLAQNPSLNVGIDNSMNGRDSDLDGRRVDTVRAALLQAGVPAYKIQIGAFGDPDREHERQVQVLIKTRI